MRKLIISLLIILSFCLPSFAITRKEVKKLIGEQVLIHYNYTIYKGRLVNLIDIDYPKEKVWYVVLLEDEGTIRAFEIKDDLIVVKRYVV